MYVKNISLTKINEKRTVTQTYSLLFISKYTLETFFKTAVHRIKRTYFTYSKSTLNKCLMTKK